MSFSIEVLKAVRTEAVQKVLEANAQITDIDQTLAVLEGHAVGAPHREVIPAEEAKPYSHVHFGGLPAANVVVPLFDNGGELPTGGDALFPVADGDLGIGLYPPVPAADEELTFTAPPPPEAKTGGRRTNEEIAAEVGVNLDDVKEWKGPGRISRADMEEFKQLHAGAAIPGQQTIEDVGEPEPDVEAAPDMWSESDTSGGEADTANESVSPETIAEVKQVQEQFDTEREQRTAPPSYEVADEAVVADDAETFEPPF